MMTKASPRGPRLRLDMSLSIHPMALTSDNCSGEGIQEEMSTPRLRRMNRIGHRGRGVGTHLRCPRTREAIGGARRSGSGAVWEGIMVAHRIREQHEVMSGAGGDPAWPAPVERQVALHPNARAYSARDAGSGILDAHSFGATRSAVVKPSDSFPLLFAGVLGSPSWLSGPGAVSASASRSGPAFGSPTARARRDLRRRSKPAECRAPSAQSRPDISQARGRHAIPWVLAGDVPSIRIARQQ